MSYLTGDYEVGTCDHEWRDGDQPVEVTAWYPLPCSAIGTAEDRGTRCYRSLNGIDLLGNTAQTVPDILQPCIAALLSVSIDYHSICTFPEAHPGLDGKTLVFPLIICSHGIGLHRRAHSSYCEDIASHGFIVVAVDHPGYCANRSGGTTFDRQKVLHTPMMEIRRSYQSDITFVLSRLLDRDDCTDASTKLRVLKRMIDREHVAVMGHSVGGGAAWQLLWQDPRVTAAVSLEGFLTNRVFHKVVDYQRKPLLIFFGTQSEDEKGNDESQEFHPGEWAPLVDGNESLCFINKSTIGGQITTSKPSSAQLSPAEKVLDVHVTHTSGKASDKNNQESSTPSRLFRTTAAKNFPENNVQNVSIVGCEHYSFCDRLLLKDKLLEQFVDLATREIIKDELEQWLGVGTADGTTFIPQMTSTLVNFFKNVWQIK